MNGLRVLIVGGYGTFGSRIVALLEDEPHLTLIVAGRSVSRARELVRRRHGARAGLEAAAFDRGANVAAELAALAPDVVVDASGPFQAYGDGCYALIEACIAAGVHYIDLADGSDFVAGVHALDARARAAGVFCLSGASSFPVLTAAVVRRLAYGVEHVDSIRAGIAPSPFAGVGENVIRAIASYAGRRVPLRRRGVTAEAVPFTEQMRFTIAPPGLVPLNERVFSLVDVPDLRVLAELWPEVESVWMGAAPVPEIWHRMLILCAHLVRLRLIRTLVPLARAMHFVTNHVRWGEHRGGMFVAIRGRNARGGTVARSWHLVVEGDDGPLIPSMAVEAVIRKLLDGAVPASGARPAIREVELADYERLFARRRIHTGTRDDSAAGPLYMRLLGDAWSELPAEIRAMHNLQSSSVAHGTAGVERGKGIVARLVARAIGFPPTAKATSLKVQFAAADGVETWTRSFGGRRFSSTQFAGRGRNEHLLCERFGPLTFAMALVVEGGRLELKLRRWSAFGISMPLFLSPRAVAYEFVQNGRFCFHVDIRHPLAGLVVRYEGSLEPPIDNGELGLPDAAEMRSPTA